MTTFCFGVLLNPWVKGTVLCIHARMHRMHLQMCVHVKYSISPVAKQIFLAKRGEKLGEEIQIREKDFEKQGKSSGLRRTLRILYCGQRRKLFLPHC
jgi:hypothetical protein